MNRTVLGVCTAIFMSAAMLGAQSQSPDSGKSSEARSGASAGAATVTFIGCLSPRGTSEAFYLTNAKEKGVKGPATTVKVVPAGKKVDLDAFVTHEVEITGTRDQATPASGSTRSTVTVTKVKIRGDQC